jgi:hypothetical protein
MGWKKEIEAVWAAVDDFGPDELIAEVDRIVGAPGVPTAVRYFEAAGARDAADRPADAVPLYQKAIQTGLEPFEDRQARIQLASSLRNLGDCTAALEILDAMSTDVGDGLDDGVVVFRAFTLSSLERPHEVIPALIHALASHMSWYSRSAHGYADTLSETNTNR